MIRKVSAEFVNRLFVQETWKHRPLACGVCPDTFEYEPFVYTYPDGQQTICCSIQCHHSIREKLRKEANIGGATDEP